MRGFVDKPQKKLTEAMFVFGALMGKNELGITVKTSEIIRWWGLPFNQFETLNTYYTVEFSPGGHLTIPEKYSEHPLYERTR
ncbi:hypothetical protein EVC02_006 [Rhizobium phage RHph_N17]|nr:hypothetical protein EVC02_006 [Rhizobium phage RHph_N17]